MWPLYPFSKIELRKHTPCFLRMLYTFLYFPPSPFSLSHTHTHWFFFSLFQSLFISLSLFSQTRYALSFSLAFLCRISFLKFLTGFVEATCSTKHSSVLLLKINSSSKTFGKRKKKTISASNLLVSRQKQKKSLWNIILKNNSGRSVKNSFVNPLCKNMSSIVSRVIH